MDDKLDKLAESLAKLGEELQNENAGAAEEELLACRQFLASYIGGEPPLEPSPVSSEMDGEKEDEVVQGSYYLGLDSELSPTQIVGKNLAGSLLLLQKDSLAEKDDYGNTLLHTACAERSVECIQTLLDSRTIDVNARNDDGKTALHTLCEMVRLGYNGNIWGRNLECMDILLSSDFGVDINAQDADGSTCCHLLSAKNCHGYSYDKDSSQPPLDCLKRLVQSDVDVNLLNAEGCGALHMAAFHGNADALGILLDSSNAEINICVGENLQSSTGDSVLHACVGSIACLQILLERRVRNLAFSIVDDCGQTALERCGGPNTDCGALIEKYQHMEKRRRPSKGLPKPPRKTATKSAETSI